MRGKRSLIERNLLQSSTQATTRKRGWWFFYLTDLCARKFVGGDSCFPWSPNLGQGYPAFHFLIRFLSSAFLSIGDRLLEPVTLTSIQTARARISDAIHVSPCQLSHHLSELTGVPLHLKLENLQRTGSFKERGALNKLLTLSETERKHGVIAASAGNHAQGVAFHATARGIRAQILMPLAPPQIKVAATRAYGAEVILHGASYDEACDEALRRHVEEGRTFIHPFDDPQVIC